MPMHAQHQQVPTVADLHKLRAYHAAKIQQIDGALAVMKEAIQLRRLASRQLGAVRARVEHEDDRAHEADRAPRPRAQRAPTTRTRQRATATVNRARQREGTRVIDVVRQVFADAGPNAIPREDVYVLGKIEKHVTAGKGEPIEARAARALGLVLAQMVRQKELKDTPAGYIARKLRADAPVNGSGAHA